MFYVKISILLLEETPMTYTNINISAEEIIENIKNDKDYQSLLKSLKPFEKEVQKKYKDYFAPINNPEPIKEIFNRIEALLPMFLQSIKLNSVPPTKISYSSELLYVLSYQIIDLLGNKYEMVFYKESDDKIYVEKSARESANKILKAINEYNHKAHEDELNEASYHIYKMLLSFLYNAPEVSFYNE